MSSSPGLLSLPFSPMKTSFLPPASALSSSPSLSLSLHLPTRIKTATTAKTPPTTIRARGGVKLVRCPALDRHASKYNRLRFARKLKTLLLSKPRQFLPLRILARCRGYLGLPSSRPLLPMVLRYPALFRLTRNESSLLSVSLTPAAAALAAAESLLRRRLSASLAAKLHRLLMLAAPHHRLPLSKLAHLVSDLGLPPDFRSSVCSAHPDRFKKLPDGNLALVSWDPHLAVTLIKKLPRADLIIDRPPKFKQLELRRGLNLKRWHRDQLIKFHESPEVSPYSPAPEEEELQARERRACAVVREVVGMTVEKRTLVDHLTHFRREFGLPNRLRAMLVRHPEMFHVSIKGQRDSVFLVEAYDDHGRLLAEDELLETRERLLELVREGKRMRRERRRDTGYGDDDESEDDDDDDDDEEEESGDGFDDLFDSGIGDDWEDFAADYDIGGDDAEIGEFWSMRAAAERVDDGGGGLEAW